MWHLSSENDARIMFVLPGKNLTLGRSLDGQNCNFAIPDDPSISRKHASLLISDGSLYLKDLGSKYGTFINNSANIESNTLVKLNCNDVIKFGKMSCVWEVHQTNLTTCTSTLKGENLQNLRNIIGKLGGTIKNEWDDSCKYLTMPAITLTIKVVLALVQNSHIVTVDYWNKCLESTNNNIKLPNPDVFVPQILESTLNKENVSFLPKKERCKLFSDKKVIFFSRRQLELYRNVLTKSSACALLLSESKMTKSTLCGDEVIVIQYTISSTSQETQAQKDQIKDIVDYLNSKGKRVVADAEIGLAILYCSTSKYCNPDFNFSSEVIKQVPCQKKINNILAPETQEPSMALCRDENYVVDESLTPINNSMCNSNISKRKLSEEGANSIMNVNKKLAPDTRKLSLSYNKKRINESQDTENPSKKIAMANDDDQDIFNFKQNKLVIRVETDVTVNKKLNLSKPAKRKLSADSDEELFNFVNKANKKTALEKPSNTESEVIEVPESADSLPKETKPASITEKVDIINLRGSKLQELAKLNSNIPRHKQIKKEDTTELDEKFSSIDLGSTTLVLRNDLIVKKEPVQVQSSESGLKNFKKFKKVWPIKMQIMIVS